MNLEIAVTLFILTLLGLVAYGLVVIAIEVCDSTLSFGAKLIWLFVFFSMPLLAIVFWWVVRKKYILTSSLKKDTQ